MVECFHTITIDAKRLHFRCAQYCIILPSRNKSFSRNPFEFLHIRESLVSRSSGLDPRDSRLDTRDSILERFEHQGSRIESRGSSFECQLTFERYCILWCPSRVCPGTTVILALYRPSCALSCSFHSIGRIRKYLSQADTERIVHAFVLSKLDYCNSLLYGLPSREIEKLERLQNTAARLTVCMKKTDHITLVLKKLHWLPVNDRITFKLLLLTYKSFNGLAPVYINELLYHYTPCRSLRSSDSNFLAIPKTTTITYGDRSFAAIAPKLWNQLQLCLMASTTCH